MQALSKIMRMSVCARKLLPKLFQHFDNFSWNDKKLCGLDWWAWDYLDLPYAEESRWIPKFKSFGMMINSRLWALRPKTTEPHDGQHSIGGALSTDWFLLISIDFYWSVDSPRSISSNFQLRSRPRVRTHIWNVVATRGVRGEQPRDEVTHGL